MLIQRIHQYLSNSFVMVPLCLLIFFVSTSAKAHPPIAKAEYSGEELFRGIFFAQGPVAQKISVLQAFDINRFIKDAKQKRELVDFQNRIVTTIAKDHGAFLKELESAVASRNKFKIRKTLLRGNEILIDVSTLLSGNERDFKKEEALQKELAQKINLNEASAEEISKAAEEIFLSDKAPDVMIVTPICVILIYFIVVFINNLEIHPDGLFQEQLVSEISNL